MNARLALRLIKSGPLLLLSLQWVTKRDPTTPTNDERLRALRSVTPVEIGNGYDWPHCKGARYAMEQSSQSHITHYAARRGE